MNYFVYILKCSDDSLYTGYTKDLDRRVREHNEGRGAKYTKVRLPVKLVYHEIWDSVSLSLKREIEIKKMTRIQKLKLVEGTNV
jgi:putative endonuclease